MFDAVIFDWDGTLADTRGAVVASFKKVLRESPFEIPNGFIESKLGTSAHEIFREIVSTAKMAHNEDIIKDLVNKRIQA